MERRTDLIDAERIMGKNFIGPEQLESIKVELGIKSPLQLGLQIPVIPFDKTALEKYSGDYILILGNPEAHDNMPLTINKLREIFGINPDVKEPCFYNQDWYLHENFIHKTLDLKWYMLKKYIIEEYRSLRFEEANIILEKIPSAILCAYTFFCYYFLNSQLLWENDYVWCSDKDSLGDQIYIGNYKNKNKKSGLEIHRHLKIKNNYSFITVE